MNGSSARGVVRLAATGDESAIKDVVRRAYEGYVTRIGREPAPMTADYTQDITAGRVWVGSVDDRVVGVLVLHVEPHHLLVENVAVDLLWQGHGIGSALLGFAEDHASSVGITTIRLYTNELMTENLAYYPRRGFIETGRRTEGGFRRVFFAKALPTD